MPENNAEQNQSAHNTPRISTNNNNNDDDDSATLTTNQQTRSFTKASDYEIALVIGEGSFGRVWYGRHAATQTPVAIKVLDRQNSSSLSTEQAILQQCKGSGRVPELYASFLDNHCLYMVMECMDGGTLDDWIHHVHHHHSHNTTYDNGHSTSPQNDHPPFEENCIHRTVISMAHQLRETLLWLHHSQHMIHGDVKPSNCLVQTTLSSSSSSSSNHPSAPFMRILLTDFGSAQRIQKNGITTTSISSSSPSHHYTRKSSFQGTTAFSAPEVLGIAIPSRIHKHEDNNNLHDSYLDSHKTATTTTTTTTLQESTTAIDWWALGCTLYALFTGRASPFSKNHHHDQHVAADVDIIDAIREYCEACCGGGDCSNTSSSSSSRLRAWWQKDHERDTASSSIPSPWKMLIQESLLSPLPHIRINGGEDDTGWTADKAHVNENNAVGKRDTLETLIVPPLPEWARQVRDTPDTLPWRKGSWSAFLL